MSVKDQILTEKVIGIIRLAEADKAHQAAHALAKAGMKFIEITLNTQGALSLIESLTAELPDCIIGAGTVKSEADTSNALDAGAQFLVSPIAPPEMMEIAQMHNVVTIAGGLTPTEIYAAYQLGANFIKPFPLAGIGPQYIKALKGPFPEIEFIPTNGVTLENIKAFFEAGVSAVGLGSVLVSENDTPEAIEGNAREALEIIKQI